MRLSAISVRNVDARSSLRVSGKRHNTQQRGKEPHDGGKENLYWLSFIACRKRFRVGYVDAC